ncbi:MAG: MarR family transcriptional regulator [Bacteroidia bacterium]|nr:MarR family transcriptional regulator [Bacteroidia bacterium]
MNETQNKDFEEQIFTENAYDANIINKLLLAAKKIEASQLFHSDIEALFALYRQENPFQLKASQIMNAVGLTSGATTTLINRLEKNQFVIRLSDTKDKRISLVQLTNKGRAFIEIELKRQFAMASEILSDFDDLEKRQLKVLINKVTDKFKTH